MQTEFASITEASQRWINEGKSFKDKLNNWLDEIYIDKVKPVTPCPEDTRKDMTAFVMDQIYYHNEDGEFDKLRQLFPPDNDPIDWTGITECVSQVVVLPDMRLVATVGDWYEPRRVYLISENTFELQPDVLMIGKSFDKKYIARVYADYIEVTEGWDGHSIKTFASPSTYGLKGPKDGLSNLNFTEFGIQQIVVFPNGQRVAIATSKGIFVLEEQTSHFIETEENSSHTHREEFTFRYDYPHVDVSPDGKYMITGSQSSPHLLFEEINGQWTTIATVEPRSSYPNLARFNTTIEEEPDTENSGPQVLLCSCHISRSASIALPLTNLTPNFYASGYNADPTLNYIDDRKWVFSAGLYQWGYALGCNDGYMWFRDYYGNLYGYLHIGGTVMDIDYSPDRTKMVVASYIGQITVYDCTELFQENEDLFRDEANRQERRKDDFAITNTCYKDIKRYLFWKENPPLVW
ncbi:hypothetical protein [Xanthocytophaga agilis]|uniref:Uncharacterized protein n=1 Tax=Xanthocytophaga agilis TaxID=3048010 RepID=A0AAE3R0N8_9BACT|nr:hypothetical protein [Xanthocytophaga agilis]MDJ1501569.1 hypothetical protein [Xanthocytophaga agilis]